MVTIRSRLPATTGRLFSRSYDGGAPAASSGRQAASRVRGGREAVLLLGICSAALGLLVAVWPGKSDSSLGLLFGLGVAVSAGVQVFLAVRARFAMPLRALLLLSGVLSAWLAVLCLSGGSSVAVLSMWLGLSWAIAGVSQATVSVWDERLAEPVRHELVGVATMLVGVVVLLSPLESATALGLVAAAGLVLLGSANLALAGVGRGAAHIAWTNRIPVSHI